MKKLLLSLTLLAFASASVLIAEEKAADAPKPCPMTGGCCKGGTNAPAKSECPAKSDAKPAPVAPKADK